MSEDDASQAQSVVLPFLRRFQLEALALRAVVTFGGLGCELSPTQFQHELHHQPGYHSLDRSTEVRAVSQATLDEWNRQEDLAKSIAEVAEAFEDMDAFATVEEQAKAMAAWMELQRQMEIQQ